MKRQLTYLDFDQTNFLTDTENNVRALVESQQVRTQTDEDRVNFLKAEKNPKLDKRMI